MENKVFANQSIGNKRLTTQEAAEYLGVKKQSLETWRCTGRYAIPYVRIGAAIRYNQSDLDAYIAANRHGVVETNASGCTVK